MRFSIITPSFRNSAWLRLCIASVADQDGVDVEHIVQDAGSDDGTLDWLPGDRRVRAFVEKDQGMYDAVNRGFRRARGDVLAYLNCDEQYLPGALQKVEDCFGRNPDLDVLFADTIVTDGRGSYLCHRPTLVPRLHLMWVRFPVLTCALFIRRRVIEEAGIVFDTRWRDLGDWWWVREMLLRRQRMGVLPQFTSVFADTGENMNLKPNAVKERQQTWLSSPRWVRMLRVPIAVHNRLRLASRRPWIQRPFSYSLYTLESPDRRVQHSVQHPTSFWKGRAGN